MGNIFILHRIVILFLIISLTCYIIYKIGSIYWRENLNECTYKEESLPFFLSCLFLIFSLILEFIYWFIPWYFPEISV